MQKTQKVNIIVSVQQNEKIIIDIYNIKLPRNRAFNKFVGRRAYDEINLALMAHLIVLFINLLHLS
jgi:hypothetical protein